MSVITLSRQLGGYGEEIAGLVAQKLDLRLIDAQTIHQAAQRAGVPDVALAEMEHEGQRGLVDRVLFALRTMPSLRSSPAYATPKGDEGMADYHDAPSMASPFTGFFSPTAPPISASLESYVHMVGLVIRGLAREGNVLIVGRGGQVMLKNRDDILHVQVVAPLLQRIQVILDRESLSWREAQSRVRASDRARYDYVRRYHNADWLDSSLYHLVINTGRVPIPSAVDLIVTAHRMMAANEKKDE